MSAPLVGRDVPGTPRTFQRHAPRAARVLRAPRTFQRHAPRAARVLRAPTHGRDALLHGRSAEVFQPSDSEKDVRRETRDASGDTETRRRETRAPSPSHVSRLTSFRFTSPVSCLSDSRLTSHVRPPPYPRQSRPTSVSGEAYHALQSSARRGEDDEERVDQRNRIPHLPMKRRTANLSETPRSRCNVQVISLTRGSRKIANAWSTANRTSRSRCRFRS